MARQRKKQPQSTMDRLAGPLAFSGLLLVLLWLAACAVAGKFTDPWVFIFLGAGVVLLAVAFSAKPAETVAFFKSRQAKMGANTTVMMLAFLGIVVFVNVISNRHHARLDLTKNKYHTLSQQTKNIMKGLKQPVHVRGYYSATSGGDFQRMRDLLNEYKYLNPKKLKVRIIDANLRPTDCEADGITRLPTTVFECPKTKKTERVYSGAEEKDITAAILKVSKEKKKKFYFLQGHGEHKWDGFEEDGMSKLKEALEKLNHECAELNLMAQGEIPDDCTVLVIAGPKYALPEQERDLIRDYLEAHGRALVMIDSPTAANKDVEQLSDILTRWGVTPSASVVVEPQNNFFQDASVVMVTNYENHEITRPLRGAAFSMMLLAGHLELEETQPPDPQYGGPPPNPDQDFEVHSLAKSSSSSWDVVDFSPATWEQRGASGPFDLAAVVTSGAPKPPPSPYAPPPPDDDNEEKTRLVVLADSDLATNRWITQLANGNFVLNCLNWLAQETELIAIQPPDRTRNTITLSGSQQTLVRLLARYLLPLSCLLTGFVVWWRRR